MNGLFEPESHPILSLKGLEPFAIGGTRLCFVHPDHPDRCVKVLRNDRTASVRRRATRGLKKLRPLHHWDDQLKEIQAYRHLCRVAAPTVWMHVPEYFGTIDTDLGLGIVTRIFRNFDSSYPNNLEQEVPSGLDDALESALEEFKRWLRQDLVVTRDLLPHNIIVVKQSNTKSRLVIVDGLGNSEWIPVSTWFRSFAVRKINRKIEKFERRVQLLEKE